MKNIYFFFEFTHYSNLIFINPNNNNIIIIYHYYLRFFSLYVYIYILHYLSSILKFWILPDEYWINAHLLHINTSPFSYFHIFLFVISSTSLHEFLPCLSSLIFFFSFFFHYTIVYQNLNDQSFIPDRLSWLDRSLSVSIPNR